MPSMPFQRTYYIHDQDMYQGRFQITLRNIAFCTVASIVLLIVWIYGMVVTAPWFPSWTYFNWVPFTIFLIIAIAALVFLNTYWQLHRMELRSVQELRQEIERDVEAAYARRQSHASSSFVHNTDDITIIEGDVVNA